MFEYIHCNKYQILTNSNQQTQSYKFTSHIAAFLSVVLITEMLEICIQTSYDQIVQLILKSYLPVVYGTSLSWIFIVLAHWNNSPWVDMLLYSNTLSKFKSSQFLLFLHNAECFIVEKQQISMLLFLTQQGPKPMIYQTRGEHPPPLLYLNFYKNDETSITQMNYHITAWKHYLSIVKN